MTVHRDDCPRGTGRVPVEELFDEWAKSGQAEKMEAGHKNSVVKFLDTVAFEHPFSFLDVGCGNGWVVRMIHQKDNCRLAVGIDKSSKMIVQAQKMSHDANGSNDTSMKFIHTDVESCRYSGRFDFVFSMESLYYADSVEAALKKIYRLLKPGGRFFCGTDFYAENKATARWTGIMNVRMHHYSKKEWIDLFMRAGFEASTQNIKNPKSVKKWARQWGTLFITGVKPTGQGTNQATIHHAHV